MDNGKLIIFGIDFYRPNVVLFVCSLENAPFLRSVIPAKAGIQIHSVEQAWIPASAGMTVKDSAMWSLDLRDLRASVSS